MNNLELIAKDLVKCGYCTQDDMEKGVAETSSGREIIYTIMVWDDTLEDYTREERVDPFADTLPGRQQADALEDWLIKNQLKLWGRARYNVTQLQSYNSQHRERLDRIKWCYDQLAKE